MLSNVPFTGPPEALSRKILDQVRRDLHPHPGKVFARLLWIHILVSCMTLSVCPQFGLRIWGNGMGLMEVFMNLGPYGCLLACGSFFVGSSILVASIWIRPEELKVLRKSVFLQVSALALLTLGFFVMLDREMILRFSLVWVLGFVMTGVSLIELVAFFRLGRLGRLGFR